ncbi:MAG: hypothetical protein LUC90_07485 [Lachnospiraceae bacterium]|nr:hypothetical protein [Lachnospiraceae bacterium]
MISNQRYMLRYHTTLTGEHTFASSWYTWPLMLKSVLYYSNTIDQTLRQGISGMGNPLVWWAGIPAFFYLIYFCVKNYFSERISGSAGNRRNAGNCDNTGNPGNVGNPENAKDRKSLASGSGMETELYPVQSAGFLLVAYLSCYLPWCLVSRTTFIYHYFPCVPLVVCMITVSLAQLKKRMSGKKFTALLLIYSAAALGLFVLFYPVLSGRTVSKEFVETFLEWLDGWRLVL